MLFEQLRPRNTPTVVTANTFHRTLYIWGDGHDNVVYSNADNDTFRGHNPNDRILGRHRHGTLDENHDGIDRLPDENTNDGLIANAGMGLDYGGSRSQCLIP